MVSVNQWLFIHYYYLSNCPVTEWFKQLFVLLRDPVDLQFRKGTVELFFSALQCASWEDSSGYWLFNGCVLESSRSIVTNMCGARLELQSNYLHVASSCGLGFLTAWWPQGSYSSYMVIQSSMCEGSRL